MAGLVAWSRPAIGVITDHLQKITEVGMRKTVIPAMLRKNGRIKYGASAADFDWLTVYQRDPPSRSGDLEPASFVRVNRHKKASAGYSTLNKGELISKGEKLMFQGDKTARYKLLATVVEKVQENCQEYFARTEIYNNSQDSSNSDGLDGLETLFQTSSTVIDSNTWHASVTGTYANLTMDLGTYGGAANNATSTDTYPMGTPDLAYHFWHPMVVNYKATKLTATTKTWINTWREAQRKARTFMEAMHGVTPDLWLTDPISYEEALTSLEEKERMVVGDQDQDLVKLGFRHIRIDGIAFMAEFGCTPRACYGLSWKNMELLSMQKTLWDITKDFDIDYGGAQKILIDFYGQMRYDSPAFFAKLNNSA
jgi:hypothetical protein